MGSSSVPDSDGFGGHPDQYAGDRVWRLRDLGAGAGPSGSREPWSYSERGPDAGMRRAPHVMLGCDGSRCLAQRAGEFVSVRQADAARCSPVAVACLIGQSSGVSNGHQWTTRQPR